MGKWLSCNLAIVLAFTVLVDCVPTSVLVDTKDSSKVKRASDSLKSESVTSTSNEKVTTGSSASGEKQQQQKILVPQKRGASPYKYQDVDLANDILVNNIPNGIWEDFGDSSALYPDLDSEYQKSLYESNHQLQPQPKTSYDNLQNILNSQLYTEPIALPLEYPYKYYGDRKKRSNNKKSLRPLRPKRDSSKLNPADMLALVALMEASQQQGRFEPDLIDSNVEYGSPYMPYGVYVPQQQQQQQQQQLQQDDEQGEWMNSWTEPAIEYYGLPYDLQQLSPSAYETVRDNSLGRFKDGYPAKRFMVAKKKRSLENMHEWRWGQQQRLPFQHNIARYENDRYSLPDFMDYEPKKNHKYF